MQRRAAALYFALFLVIGAGSYAYVTTGVDAQRPEISLEDAENYALGENITVDGRTYTVSEIESINESTGSGVLKYVNESFRATTTLENGSTYDGTWANETSEPYMGASWDVHIQNASNVSEFTLRGQQNASQVLVNSSEVEDEPVDYQGESRVVYTNGSIGPTVDEYVGEPTTYTISEGDTFAYNGSVQDATVESVSGDAATLAWTTSKENTVQLEQGGNVTLADGQQRVAYLPDNETLQLSTDVAGYQNQLDRQDYFGERKAGLWGVSIVSFLAAIILLGAAYLPVKD
jgi:hypothetical protein